MEHGFAREETADRDAIDAAHELAAPPAFDAVGVSFFMQSRVGFDEPGADPGALAARSGRGATINHLSEGAIHRDLEDAFAQDSRQTSRDVKSVQFKNGARVRGPPGDRIVRPWKITVSICQQQTRHGQIAADGDQTIKLAALFRRTRIGKPQAGGENGGHERVLIRNRARELAAWRGLSFALPMRPAAPFGSSRRIPSPHSNARFLCSARSVCRSFRRVRPGQANCRRECR